MEDGRGRNAESARNPHKLIIINCGRGEKEQTLMDDG